MVTQTHLYIITVDFLPLLYDKVPIGACHQVHHPNLLLFLGLCALETLPPEFSVFVSCLSSSVNTGLLNENPEIYANIYFEKIVVDSKSCLKQDQYLSSTYFVCTLVSKPRKVLSCLNKTLVLIQPIPVWEQLAKLFLTNVLLNTRHCQLGKLHV